jgi:hypothetical protein
MDAGKAAVIGAGITAGGTIIAAIIAVSAGLLHFGKPDPSLRFPVAVLDGTEGNAGVPDAEVSLNIPDLSTERTDSGGKYAFQLNKDIVGRAARLTVSKSGFKDFDQAILSLQPRDEYQRVYLQRTSVVSSPPLQADRPPELTRIYSSGPKISGSMKSFSEWYTLCSTDEPGYQIRTADFKLSGDRVCNAWSECQQASSSPGQVCWRFRLQGHDEWPPPGQANSEGILTVTWSRQ